MLSSEVRIIPQYPLGWPLDHTLNYIPQFLSLTSIRFSCIG